MPGSLTGTTLAVAVGCALNGGVFFAFSSFVMAGLKRLPAPQGIAAMQSVNVTALTPLFMGALFGTAVAVLAVLVWSAVAADGSARVLAMAGGAVYLAGVIGVTAALNVPLNDRLAAASATDPASVRLWADYLSDWTMWNHVRTVAGIAAAGLLVAAAAA
ncbi:MAG TPA: anthrone oxygenase family protein [Thermoleophilaceae bacterium]|nr:anthrone oxygenase family protein [Thermoleophilaceae bacterium]